MTKINILKTELEHLHEYSPIEHVSARLNIHDIAGVRVVCSFIADAYVIADMLTTQRDITVVEVKDYIAHPKPNGYKCKVALDTPAPQA